MRTRSALFLVALVALVTAAAVPVAARTNDRSKPVLMVHGYNPFNSGADCHLFDPLRDRLVARGMAIGKWVTVKYHHKDFGCTVDVHNYRRTGRTLAQGHREHFGNTPTSYKECKHETQDARANRHMNSTCMEHYAYHLAWMIWSRYSSKGIAVDIVAHSMGGLIVRYALGKVEQGSRVFPSKLLVEDVVTMGSPHGGTDSANWCTDPTCLAARKGSTFVTMLNSTSRPWFRHPDPNPDDRTDWTVMGAWDDGVVDEVSAVAMTRADHRVQYLDSADYDHDAFYRKTSNLSTADVRWRNTGDSRWRISFSQLHGARWVDRALVFGTW